jgi:uracil-DNA glycosylase
MTLNDIELFTGARIEESWRPFFEDELKKDYFPVLLQKVEQAYAAGRCYPAKENIFRAFALTAQSTIKGVLLGQDPYHGENQAMGLAFSVPDGVKRPPSLLNIYKELYFEYGYPVVRGGNLISWAQQGLLMLNSVLTVQAGKAASHAGFGWQTFTDNVISYLSAGHNDIFFFLWGNYAKAKKRLITNPACAVFCAAHPSPLAGDAFLHCNCFKEANSFLAAKNKEPINWQIKDCF